MHELDFYRGKTIFVTGHTGFKGSWLCSLLLEAGANVVGYALEPPTVPNMFTLLRLSGRLASHIGDIRDLDALCRAMREAKPEIVFHLAAQPLVRESYLRPIETFAANAMGTANLLEAALRTETVRSVVVITTDKVYENRGLPRRYRETDPLGGADPYSASKACAELVAQSYFRSFYSKRGIGLCTARAGNVIGGGDYAKDRLLPDCVRAVRRGRPVVLRNPRYVRPWQHVLEPLRGYLALGRLCCEEHADGISGESFNFGPEPADCVPVESLVRMFCAAWGAPACYRCAEDVLAPVEAAVLQLDNGKAARRFGWTPTLHVKEAVRWAVEWEQAPVKSEATAAQIRRFLDLAAQTCRQREAIGNG